MKNNKTGMTLIVKTITRLTVGLILIYGIYIVMQGHISPGGGFAGGVIAALSFVHLMLAFGKDAVLKKLSAIRGVRIGSAAALLFLSLAVVGFVKGGRCCASESQHFKLFAAGLIPFYDSAIAVMSGSVLFVIFLALVLLVGEVEK
jgi:multicomponent Na+:H+ antiporter subunit B